MANEQTVLQAQVLALLGWVDGNFDASEIEASEHLLGTGLDVAALKEELKRLESAPPAKADVLAQVQAVSQDVARAAIKSGFALARADGYVHQGELGILFELSVAVGISEEELTRIGNLSAHQAFLELEKLY